MVEQSRREVFVRRCHQLEDAVADGEVDPRKLEGLIAAAERAANACKPSERDCVDGYFPGQCARLMVAVGLHTAAKRVLAAAAKVFPEEAWISSASIEADAYGNKAEAVKRLHAFGLDVLRSSTNRYVAAIDLARLGAIEEMAQVARWLMREHIARGDRYRASLAASLIAVHCGDADAVGYVLRQQERAA